MKRRFSSLTSSLTLLVGVALLLTACGGDDDDPRDGNRSGGRGDGGGGNHNVNTEKLISLNVNLATALDGLTEECEGDFTLQDPYYIRVQCFIYDEAGNLECSNKAVAGQYADKVIFKFGLLNGDYTAIVTTDLIDSDNADSYSQAYWEYSGTQQLSTFAVEGQDVCDIMGERLLTLTATKLHVQNDASVAIDVQAVTAMIDLMFMNIHYADDYLIDGEAQNYIYYDVSYPHDFNYVRFTRLSSNGLPWSFEATGESDYYILNWIDPREFEADNIYGFHAVLPGAYKFTGYGEYTVEGDEETILSVETAPSNMVTVYSGLQYYLDVDLGEAWQTSFYLAGTEKAPAAATRLAAAGSGAKAKAIPVTSLMKQVEPRMLPSRTGRRSEAVAAQSMRQPQANARTRK